VTLSSAQTVAMEIVGPSSIIPVGSSSAVRPGQPNGPSRGISTISSALGSFGRPAGSWSAQPTVEAQSSSQAMPGNEPMRSEELPEATITATGFDQGRWGGNDSSWMRYYVDVLQDVVALIAYEQPEASPLGWLLGSAQRERVADAVNSAIAQAAGAPPQRVRSLVQYGLIGTRCFMTVTCTICHML
jgi:hypothetical protein